MNGVECEGPVACKRYLGPRPTTFERYGGTLCPPCRARFDSLLDAARGLSTWRTAKVANRLTSGVDWRGSKKLDIIRGLTVPETPVGFRGGYTGEQFARVRAELTEARGWS